MRPASEALPVAEAARPSATIKQRPAILTQFCNKLNGVIPIFAQFRLGCVAAFQDQGAIQCRGKA
jgi:hypothetical protein